MATVVWTNKAQEEKRKLYLEGRLRYGVYIAKKTAQKITRIQKSLENFPELGYREPLLEMHFNVYRACYINKRFKIIYYYNEENDVVVIEDIWDMYRSPQNLKKEFKGRSPMIKFRVMNTLALEQETKNYWQMLKGASDQVKLSLISLLSSSLVSKKTVADSSEMVSEAKIRPEDLEITPFVASIGQNIKPLPADFDYDKAKEDYLMQKYG